ncbi:hypothetical protein AC564_2828 [Lacticaseibacillus paracasei]|nr:hypothetical protein Lpp226_0292 [Lacticaseibacillus paracasei subsp. paracasei Lpp226]KTE97407.1 hypothetical protein AC564_2828 [Lacticaseibacillus paracasei]
MQTTQRPVFVADVVRRLRDRGLCGLKAPSQRSSPSWPEIAEFGTARKF